MLLNIDSKQPQNLIRKFSHLSKLASCQLGINHKTVSWPLGAPPKLCLCTATFSLLNLCSTCIWGNYQTLQHMCTATFFFLFSAVWVSVEQTENTRHVFPSVLFNYFVYTSLANVPMATISLGWLSTLTFTSALTTVDPGDPNPDLVQTTFMLKPSLS